MTWRTRWLLSSAAAGIVLAGWLLALAFAEAVPPLSQPIAPPPLWNPHSVTPGYSYEPTVLPIPTAAAIGTKPRNWAWYVSGGCHPALALSPVCWRPTPSPSGYIGQ